MVSPREAYALAVKNLKEEQRSYHVSLMTDADDDYLIFFDRKDGSSSEVVKVVNKESGETTEKHIMTVSIEYPLDLPSIDYRPFMKKVS